MRRRFSRGWLILGASIALALVLIGIGVSMAGSGPGAPPGAGSSGPPSTGAAPPTSTGAPTSTATAPPGTGPPGRPAPQGEQFGASVNYLFNGHDFSARLIARQLRALQRTGVTVARTDAFWEATEPTPPVNGVHRFDWGFDDRVAVALAQHGLQWLPILDYTAPWAQSVPGQDHSPPRSDAAYVAYAAAFAARYGPGGTFWRLHPELTPQPVQTYEIWNEPDNGQFWVPAPNAAQYADLYQRAREAIAAVQPDSRVIVGGLMRPTSFLPELLAAHPQLRGHIDGIAIHPYGNPLVTLSRIRAARATITSLGLGPVPLYVTEFGWTTMPATTVDYAPQSARPSYLTQTLTALGHLNCGVAAAVLYTWVSPERNPDDGQQWYGINSVDGAATPDVAAFVAGLRAARSPRPAISLCAS